MGSSLAARMQLTPTVKPYPKTARPRSGGKNQRASLRLAIPHDTEACDDSKTPQDDISGANLDTAPQNSPELDISAWRGVLLLTADACDRPPDWRWQVAGLHCKSSKRLSRTRHDMAISAALRFRRVLENCVNDNDREVLLYKFPTMTAAWQIWQRGAQDRSRASLESRILARQPYRDISKRTGIKEQVIDCYQQLFFHVSDRLDKPDYILPVVIGLDCCHGAMTDDMLKLWRYYGYFGGVLVLEDLIGTTPPGPHPCNPAEVEQYFRGFAQSELRRQAAIAIRMLPLDDPKIWKQFLRMGARLWKLESKHPKSGSGNNVIERAVDAALDQFKSSQFSMREFWAHVEKLQPANALAIPKEEPQPDYQDWPFD